MKVHNSSCLILNEDNNIVVFSLIGRKDLMADAVI